MMVTVIIPIVLLLVIILVPAIPKIGGEVRIGLLVAGVSAAFLGGLGAADTVSAAISGIDKLAWVIMLSIFGSLYAESQVKFGRDDGYSTEHVSLALRKFLKRAHCIYYFHLQSWPAHYSATIAAATVIGFFSRKFTPGFAVKRRADQSDYTHGSCNRLRDASISQAIFLSSSLIGINPEPVLKVGTH